jgi:phosphoribosyl 1,2-cyclic phosphodiesterase
LIVLDAGTGIRGLGKSLSAAGRKSPREITLLLTHTHWDHIQGLPFFLPQLRPGSRLKILGCEGAREGLATLLARQMESPFFPVPLRGTPATIDIAELKDSSFRIGQVHGDTFAANHPGTCIGYKLSLRGASIAYFPDNEPHLGQLRASKGKQSRQDIKRAKEGHAEMVEFIRGLDLLIMDAQYDSREYSMHIGWGHGCLDDVVALAIEASVKKLVLFHHDPDHSDAKVAQMARTARRLIRKAGSNLKVEPAREGVVLQVGPSHV